MALFELSVFFARGFQRRKIRLIEPEGLFCGGTKIV